MKLAVSLVAFAVVLLVPFSPVCGQGMWIQVIEPQVGRLVALAHPSLYDAQGNGVFAWSDETGMYGEGMNLERQFTIDPKIGRGELRVVEKGIVGKMGIQYLPEASFWVQEFNPKTLAWGPGHNRGSWRPDYVYRYDKNRKIFVGIDWATYRAIAELYETRRMRGLETEFNQQVGTLLSSASQRGLLRADQRQAIDDALAAILKSGVKGPLQPAYKAALAAAIKDPLVAALPRIHPAVAAALETSPSAGFREVVTKATRTEPDAALVEELRVRLRDIRQLLLRAAAGPAAERAVQPVATEIAYLLETINGTHGAVPMDRDLRERVELLRIVAPADLQKRLDTLLAGKLSEDLLRNIEIQSDTSLGRAWTIRSDDALRVLFAAGARTIGGDANLSADLVRAIQAAAQPAQAIFDEGLELPLRTEDVALMQVIVEQANLPPAAAGALSRVLVAPVHPLLATMTAVGGGLEDLIINARTKAPVPPAIAIPMDRPWVLPVVVGIPCCYDD